MGQISYIKRTKVPAGASSTKMISGIVAPADSQVLHIGYGGQRGCQMIVTKDAGTLSTLDIKLQGRADPLCPWFDLGTITHPLTDATSAGAATGEIFRLGSTQGAFSEMRVSCGTLTGGAAIDAWILVSPSA